MRKTSTALAVPILAGSLALSGCGGSSSPSSNGGTVTNTSTVAAGSGTTCPTDNTQPLAKTRFVTNVGLAAGTFYQWIYKPYQAGKFAQGADRRTWTIAKAVAAGAFSAKQVKDATVNVKSDPQLCKLFLTPMNKLQAQLNTMGDKIRSGDVGAITGTATTLTEITGLAKQNGIDIDTSKSGL